jgi:meiotically up-regulated gene 157 (Mug157) protein
MFAFEVDGFGSVNLMDDANIPSLLSLPYLGYISTEDPLYKATRAFVWSERQGFWWNGTAGAGIGGPHAGVYNIWPMSMWATHGVWVLHCQRCYRYPHLCSASSMYSSLSCLSCSLMIFSVMYALTSNDDSEIEWSLSVLKNSSAGTGFLHECFEKDDVTIYRRPWFAWVNALFGELIIQIARERPWIIFGRQKESWR